MRILHWKLSLSRHEMEDKVEERTATGCLTSSLSLRENKRENEAYRAVICVEGSSIPVRGYVSLQVPFCGCWPYLGRSYRVANFNFEDKTSCTAVFDMNRVLKCGKKVGTSLSHVKVCVLTQGDRLVARISLDYFLDELTRRGPLTCFRLKVGEGIIQLKLVGQENIETSCHISHDQREKGRDLSQSLQEDQEHQGVDYTTDKGTDQTLTDTLSQEEVTEEWVHRSIHVAPRLRERLSGPGDCFLEYLRCHYSALVYMEYSRKKLHLKGLKKNVEDCNLFVRALLEKWRRDETGAVDINMTDPSLFRLFH